MTSATGVDRKTVLHVPEVEHTGLALSVVIPVYNEQDILAGTIATVVDALQDLAAVDRLEVVVAENGSTDGTRALARRLAAQHDELRLLESDTADYGAAMRDGIRAASGDVIVSFDADYYDVEFVRHALETDADIVVAAKGMDGSVDTRALLRRVVSRRFSWFVRRLLHVRITETHGMKLYRRAAIAAIVPEVHATKDLFDTELLARAEWSGLSIAELPITTEEMRAPRSSILRRIPRTVWGLMKLRLRTRRQWRPTATGSSDGPAPSPALVRLAADPEAFGQRLYVAGRAAVVPGVEDALVAFDASGTTVLVAVLPTVPPGSGSRIADELDRLSQLAPAQLHDGSVASPDPTTELAAAHAAFFGRPAHDPVDLHHDQRAIVVVRERPDATAWAELLVELGGQLAGVHLLDGDAVVPLDVPDELRRGRRTGVLVPVLVAALVLLGGTAAMLALRTPDPGTATAVTAGSSVRDVVTGVPAAATHNQWIGQSHATRLSDGTVVVAYGTDQGLQIATDHANHGRSWDPPTTMGQLDAMSSSLAVDDTDRLHVALSDGTRVSYVVLEQRGTRWTSSDPVELDTATTTPYVDIAYDDDADLAHVVWVEEGPDGQSPAWAALSSDGDRGRVAETRSLASPGSAVPVLVNVASGPDSRVVATYRRGDAPTGWFTRTLAPGTDGASDWGRQERVPTDAGIGAGAVVLDVSGVAHLVLRDSTTFELTYFTRDPGGRWSPGETAVDADSIEEIDVPSLTVDRTSRLVHLFFQSDRSQGPTRTQVAVRDPATGWTPPVPAADVTTTPEGAVWPSAVDDTSGAPMVLWITQGAVPTLQATVIAP